MRAPRPAHGRDHRLGGADPVELDPWVYVGTYPTDPHTTPQSPPFAAGISNADPAAPLRFRWRNLDGGLEIEGDWAGGAVGDTLFTLPDGPWRRDQDHRISVPHGAADIAVLKAEASTGNIVWQATATSGGGGAPMWPTFHHFPLMSNAYARRSDGWGMVDVNPAVEAVHNASLNNYRDSTGGAVYTRAANDGEYFIVAARLGPKGSKWQVSSVEILGPDHGRVQLYMATLTETGDGTVGGLTGGQGEIETATYLNIQPSIYDDQYDATQQVSVSTNQNQFVIDGDDGDPFTAVTAGGPYGARLNGGAGLWALKFQVSGKHPSSSGYKAAYCELSLTRVDENNNPLG